MGPDHIVDPRPGLCFGVKPGLPSGTEDHFGCIQKGFHGGRQAGRGNGRNQPSRLAVADNVFGARNVEPNGGKSGGHPFENHVAEGFREGGEQEQVGRSINSGEFRTVLVSCEEDS